MGPQRVDSPRCPGQEGQASPIDSMKLPLTQAKAPFIVGSAEGTLSLRKHRPCRCLRAPGPSSCALSAWDHVRLEADPGQTRCSPRIPVWGTPCAAGGRTQEPQVTRDSTLWACEAETASEWQGLSSTHRSNKKKKKADDRISSPGVLLSVRTGWLFTTLIRHELDTGHNIHRSCLSCTHGRRPHCRSSSACAARTHRPAANLQSTLFVSLANQSDGGVPI